MLLWHTLATYFRRKYGVRVQKIPLDAGATCPNRDGTLSARGCIFCNDSGSGSGMGLRGLDLRAQWDAWYTKYTTTDSDRLFMAYLQSFSNTYGPASRLAHLLEQVAALPGCRGIAVGTRPDCLDGEKLALLAGCGLDEVWLELGLQTCRDDTLRRINRGHTARQAEEAVRAALDAGLLVCGHLMAGLPGEDENDFLDGVDWAVSLGMQGLKLHNVYVPQGTELARQWRAGGYRPLARDEYVDMLCAALPRIPSTVVMQRIQADPAPGELLAPAWALEKRGIITDLLTLTQMDSHSSPLRVTKVDLSALTEETVHTLQITAEQKGQTLTADIAPGITLDGDSGKLMQIFYNLTDNAIKYTPENGHIAVRLAQSGANVLFAVTDDGIGIPAEDVPRLFERFYRVDKARSRQAGGSGLGLSIVHELVERNFGTIEVSSKEGEGTKFTVRMPYFELEEDDGDA